MDNIDKVELRKHHEHSKPRSITGEFMYSHLEPVSHTNTAGGETTTKSLCELNCHAKTLSVYELSSCAEEKTPFLIIPKIRKVTRNKHDKEYFCLEYGTEKNQSNIFLIITGKSDADEWERELRRITGQASSPRPQSSNDSQTNRPKIKNKNFYSSPKGLEGFCHDQSGGHSREGEEGDSKDVPAKADDSGTKDDEQYDGTLPTSHSGTLAPNDPQDMRPRDGQRSHEESSCYFDQQEHSNNGPKDDEQSDDKYDGSQTHEPSPTSSSNSQRRIEKDTTWKMKRYGQVVHVRGLFDQDKHEDSNEDKEPVEGHLEEVLGYENISPTPENSSSSPHSDHGDEGPDEPCTSKVLEEASQKLQQQQQQQQQQPQFDPEDERSSVIQPLVSYEPTPSEISVPQSLHEDQLVGEPCPQEEAYCTHMETECSQTKVNVTVDKEDLLRTDFVRYQRSFYVKSCPERLQDRFFIGTRILLVNNEEPSNLAAMHNLIEEAKNPVNFLVQLFPLGVRVRLRVQTFTDLGIELYGNEIRNMRGDGVLSRITDGLRCMGPALPTPDAPHAMYVEQRSITAIGDHHVPFDATTEEVEDMLNTAIKNGNGLVVLQLHPTEFCHAIAPDALQRRLLKEGGSVINPRPTRRPSLARIFNPPLSPT